MFSVLILILKLHLLRFCLVSEQGVQADGGLVEAGTQTWCTLKIQICSFEFVTNDSLTPARSSVVWFKVFGSPFIVRKHPKSCLEMSLDD